VLDRFLEREQPVAARDLGLLGDLVDQRLRILPVVAEELLHAFTAAMNCSWGRTPARRRASREHDQRGRRLDDRAHVPALEVVAEQDEAQAGGQAERGGEVELLHGDSPRCTGDSSLPGRKRRWTAWPPAATAADP
jgi:hypothetical protein